MESVLCSTMARGPSIASLAKIPWAEIEEMEWSELDLRSEQDSWIDKKMAQLALDDNTDSAQPPLIQQTPIPPPPERSQSALPLPYAARITPEGIKPQKGLSTAPNPYRVPKVSVNDRPSPPTAPQRLPRPSPKPLRESVPTSIRPKHPSALPPPVSRHVSPPQRRQPPESRRQLPALMSIKPALMSIKPALMSINVIPSLFDLHLPRPSDISPEPAVCRCCCLGHHPPASFQRRGLSALEPRHLWQ